MLFLIIALAIPAFCWSLEFRNRGGNTEYAAAIGFGVFVGSVVFFGGSLISTATMQSTSITTTTETHELATIGGEDNYILDNGGTVNYVAKLSNGDLKLESRYEGIIRIIETDDTPQVTVERTYVETDFDNTKQWLTLIHFGDSGYSTTDSVEFLVPAGTGGSR